MRPFTARVVADGRKAKTYPFDRKPAPLPQPPDNSVLAQLARERVAARARFDELGHIEVKKIFDDGHLPSIWVEHAKEWLADQYPSKLEPMAGKSQLKEPAGGMKIKTAKDE